MRNIPELLAPAGSIESMKAAVKSGADAVYLSGKNFGARQFAENFSEKEISEVVSYAHLNGVKVYVTVNTLVKDSELLSMAPYLLKLYQIGVDAILVQDFGVVNLAQRIVPNLNLHASTQMTIHNEENLKWLENNGFKRAVLSRELSMDEVKSFVKSSDLDLEIFLHGALCYSYSGQCLLSSFIGGRSGNRGMCAQPCRKPYSLVYGLKDNYGRPHDPNKVDLPENFLLSTRDLAHYSHLDLLVKSGIKSLKIEGRMRSPEYVGIVVGIYRRAIDKIAEGNWKPLQEDMETLKLAFNREFTSGHLLPSPKNNIMARGKPGHRGLYLGDVKKIKGKDKKVIISLKTLTIPQKGDGLFFDTNDESKSTGFDLDIEPILNGENLIVNAKKPVKVNSKVYLTRKNDLKKLIPSFESKKRFLNLKIEFKVLENNYPELKAELVGPNGKITTKVKASMPMEEAINRPVSADEIKKQVIKVGEKPFNVIFKNLNYNGTLFMPLREINQLRRDLIDSVENKLIHSYLPSPNELKSSFAEYNIVKEELKSSLKEYSAVKEELKDLKNIKNIKKNDSNTSLSAYISDIKTLKVAKKSNFNRIYLEPTLLPESEIYENCFNPNKNILKDKNVFHEKGLFDEFVNILIDSNDICQNKDIEMVWKWPDISRLHVLDLLKSISSEISQLDMGIMVSSPGLASYLNKNQPQWKVYGSSVLNIWNNQSISHVSSLFSLLTLSPELSLNDIKPLLNKDLIVSNNSRPDKPEQTNLNPIDLEIIVQGSLESIVSQECILSSNLLSNSQFNLFKENNEDDFFVGLKDVKNQIFPLKISADCQSIIQNSAEVCLVDYLPLLMKLGFYNFSIDARAKGPLYLEKMGHYYAEALADSLNPSNLQIDKLKSKIKKVSTGGITAGNFLRGVNKSDLV
ncbi:MAG: U32 family peptidase [Methanobacteriaceae archaeon]|nr:U32 family peptidase [Methanobacteriaceae archaeon]